MFLIKRTVRKEKTGLGQIFFFFSPWGMRLKVGGDRSETPTAAKKKRIIRYCFYIKKEAEYRAGTDMRLAPDWLPLNTPTHLITIFKHKLKRRYFLEKE